MKDLHRHLVGQLINLQVFMSAQPGFASTGRLRVHSLPTAFCLLPSAFCLLPSGSLKRQHLAIGLQALIDLLPRGSSQAIETEILNDEAREDRAVRHGAAEVGRRRSGILLERAE